MRPSRLAGILILSAASASGPLWAGGAESAGHGVSTGDLLRYLGIGAALLCVAGLLVSAFVRPAGEDRYHRILFGVFALLPVVLVSTLGSVLEETKSVQSCASCHVMQSFVRDLTNPASDSLASAHYRNRWISDNQCYTCHTSYGVHGTLDAKLGGLRHWWLYVTGTWTAPIRYRGRYPNDNCLTCHGGTPKYELVATHRKMAAALLSDQTSCASCHVPHPKQEPPATGSMGVKL